MPDSTWRSAARALPGETDDLGRPIWRPGVLNSRRWGASILLALAVTFGACRFSPYFSSLEFALLYRWMALRPVQQVDPHIALVGIEKHDVDSFEATRNDPDAGLADCTCGDVCRRDLAEAVRRLKEAGASVVALDLVLAHPCPVGRNPGDDRPPHDHPLQDALEIPGETVMVVEATTNPDAVFFTKPPTDFLGEPMQEHILASPVLYNPGGVVRGVCLIQMGVPSEMEAAEKRPLEELLSPLPPLSLAAYAASVGRPCDMPEAHGPHRVVCAGAEVPVWDSACVYLLEPLMRASRTSSHTMLINWAGPPGTFPIYRLSDVIGPAGTRSDLAERFRNKVVIIGSMVERVNTPDLGAPLADPHEHYARQSGARTMCGLEVHANALNTITQRRFIRPASPFLMWGIVFVWSLLTVLAVRSMATWPAVVTVGVSVAALLAAAAVLIWVNFWVYSVVPVAAVVLSATVTGLWSYARSRHEAAVLAQEAEAREEATATIVHDLKQPLAAISGLASIIQMSQEKIEASGGSPELIERIKRQVERALSDIDEILVANPDRQLQLSPERFDMVALARDLAIAQAAKSTVHEIEVRGPEEGVWIEGDAGYLARAVSNLMDNAMKYWPDGGTVIVEVRAAATEALISVTDQGIGMDREQQALAFERYHRALPAGVNIPGTGIGLYSVRRIAQAHGGSIEVWSEPGRGSTFTLHLPLAPMSAEVTRSE